MIHVCLSLHDETGRYSKFTGTTMLSIFDNTSSDVTIHILHDNTLTTDNRDKFIYIAGCYNQHVKFYNVEVLCADKIAEMINLFPAVKTARVSVGTFYRLLAPQIFSTEIEKIIYLDSDIVVNLDIAELWRIELGDKCLAVVPEIFNRNDVQKVFSLVSDGLIDSEDYFNTGVLMMNLKRLRNEKDTLLNGMKFTSQNPRYTKFMDQDILNYCFSTRTLKLTNNFNRFTIFARRANELNLEKKIYHFAGRALKMDMDDPFNRLWMSYFIKTPWFDEHSIGRLYDGCQQNYSQLYYGLKNSLVQVSAIMSGKTRAFFATSNNIDAIKKIFSVRDDEEIIEAKDNDSLKKLIEAMNASRGQKVFFIMLPKFPFGVLVQAGFVSGRDFVNGMEFLSNEKDAQIKSYPLIMAM